MRQLWRRMTMVFGSRWVSQYGEKDDGTWAAGLRGLNRYDIARGIQRCIDARLDWPPTLPKFRELCEATPEEFGLPSTTEEAYRKAAHGDWTGHPIIFLAAQATGTYDLRREPQGVMLPKFSQHYERLKARVYAGETFEIPRAKDDEGKDAAAVTHQRERTPREAARLHIAGMRSFLRAATIRDAKAAVARVANGDDSQ